MAIDLIGMMDADLRGESSPPFGDSSSNFVEQVIPLKDIIPNYYNNRIYSIGDVTELAESIRQFGLAHDIIVSVPANVDNRYVIVSGHRRFKAYQQLHEQYPDEYGTIKAKVFKEKDERLIRLLLIQSNATSRVLTNAEKMRQYVEMEKILKDLKASNMLEGSVRDNMSKRMNESSGQIARYLTINNRLIPELLGLFEKDEIGVSLAYEIAGLDCEGQEKALSMLMRGKSLALKDIREMKEQKAREKQAPKEQKHEKEDISQGKACEAEELEEARFEYTDVETQDTYEAEGGTSDDTTLLTCEPEPFEAGTEECTPADEDVREMEESRPEGCDSDNRTGKVITSVEARRIYEEIDADLEELAYEYRQDKEYFHEEIVDRLMLFLHMDFKSKFGIPL